MNKVIAVLPFRYSPDGIRVVEVAKGDDIELTDDMLATAEGEGWVKPAKKSGKQTPAGGGGEDADKSGDQTKADDNPPPVE